MARDLLDEDTKELTDLELKVISCSKVPPQAWQSGEKGNLLGDVRQCAGFSEEARFSERTLGGLCGGNFEEGDEVEKLCSAFARTSPDARALLDRDSLGGLALLLEDGSELLLKRGGGGKWRAALAIPPSGLKDAEPADPSDLPSGAGDAIAYLNGEGELPVAEYPEDDFGKAMRRAVEEGAVEAYECRDGDVCLKLTDKGFGVYSAFHRGKDDAELPTASTYITSSGGVSMEFESLLTGLEKEGGGLQPIYLGEGALSGARDEIARRAGVERHKFNIEHTGRLELKNVGSWSGRSVPRMVDEIARYERIVAELGFTRPECSVLRSRSGGSEDTKISGGIHLTFSPPVTRLDTRRVELWDRFMSNWVKLAQWWEPLLIGVSGSPVRYNKERARRQGAPTDLDWLYSIRHHASGTVKAGAATIHRMVPDDGAVGVRSLEVRPWHRKSEEYGGKHSLGGRSDIRTRGNNIAWTGYSASDCQRVASEDDEVPGEYRDLCSTQTDQAVELRFFEYEPLHHLQERAEVVPLLMDRAYQLAAQDIEVPEAGDDEDYNDLMWRVMTEGWEAELSDEEAEKFAKLFTGGPGSIAPGADIESAGEEVVEVLWRDHYDDFFTSYFGVDNKPTHFNYLKDCKEFVERIEEGGVVWNRKTSETYGKGGVLPEDSE